MSQKIEKFVSTIEIETTEEELRKKFPSLYYVEGLEVRVNNEVVYKEENPITYSIDLLKVLIDKLPDVVSYTVTREEHESISEFKISHIRLAWLGNGKIMLITNGGDADEHYARLEKVKAELLSEGVKIKNADCEILTHIKC